VTNILVIGWGVSILWGVENCPFPLTKPVAVNTGLALPRRLWFSQELCPLNSRLIKISQRLVNSVANVVNSVYHTERPPLCTTRWARGSAWCGSVCGNWDFLRCSMFTTAAHHQPVAPRRAFASSSWLPRGDKPTAAITSWDAANSTGLDLRTCCCSVVSMVYGSGQPLPLGASWGWPELAEATVPEVAGCLLTLKRRDGCRSSLGDAGPDILCSDLLDRFDFDDPCLTMCTVSYELDRKKPYNFL